MKDALKYVFGALIMLPIVGFSLGILFGDYFDRYGEVLEVVEDTENTKIDLELSEEIIETNAPLLKYIESAKEVDDSFVFKSVFEVTTDTGVKNGTVEDDFAIYLSDIQNETGVSVIEFLSAEQIESMEEIPAAFIYDQENDLLYCYKSGAYRVIVKVYGNNGSQAQYEFILPVEAEG